MKSESFLSNWFRSFFEFVQLQLLEKIGSLSDVSFPNFFIFTQFVLMRLFNDRIDIIHRNHIYIHIGFGIFPSFSQSSVFIFLLIFLLLCIGRQSIVSIHLSNFVIGLAFLSSFFCFIRPKKSYDQTK